MANYQRSERGRSPGSIGLAWCADTLEMSFNTPVAYFLFNRPEETRRSFERIAAVRPRTLLLVADGPRDQKERERCAAARSILGSINWACDIRINFADYNMGCRRRFASGLRWVFQQVERAIILEDDCLADPTFFAFCDELLARYRDNRQISMIGGTNFQLGRRRCEDSYYFSLLPHGWGWATWRRAIRHFDEEMQCWPVLRNTTWLDDLLNHGPAARFYRDLFDRAHRGEADTWDIQWVFASFIQGALAVIPQTNLVTNIGAGPQATYTRAIGAKESDMPVMPMQFPLRHPTQVQWDIEADEFTLANSFNLPQRHSLQQAA